MIPGIWESPLLFKMLRPRFTAKMASRTYPSGTIAAILVVTVLAGAGAGYFAGSYRQLASTSLSTTTITTTTTSVSAISSCEAQGIVTGIVSVGGQTPANISLYSVRFDPLLCSGGSCQRGQGSLAPLYPSGHYSALLAPGNYTMRLYPSCKWSGCTTAFQHPVRVMSGQQIVLNIDITSP